MTRRMTRISDAANIHVLNVRDSLKDIRRLSDASLYHEESVNSERRWRLSYLQKQFKSLYLEELFDRYTQRIGHGYFYLFLILQVVLSFLHFLVVLISNMDSNTLDVVIPDIIIYAILTVLPLMCLFINDGYVKNHPKILGYMSTVAFLLLFFTNFSIPIYHSISSNVTNTTFRPAYTTHLIIAVYVFFNIHDTLLAFILGLIVTVVHIISITLITYQGSPVMLQRVFSDVIYLVCINGLGIYFRFMNEIVKRRSFLDRRACVESTLRLNFEKEQEEQLMLSIIPEHIIQKVRSNILETINYIEKNNRLPMPKPFENPYIEHHENVTILYADIVNYTEMTTKLKPVTKLVTTLNELFGRFDDASEELKVLRIKFLGDCYYCVAGLSQDPNQNHAEACVDLGLKMITIIRKVRRNRNLSIDMRIGVHSGSILSGLIGTMKWQFDVWSKDVDIANKMESTGSPGMVHITHKTKALLKKRYNIKPSKARITDELLKNNNIQTFLITPPEEPNVSSRQSETKQPNGSIKRLSKTIVNNSPESIILKPNNLENYTNGHIITSDNIYHDTEKYKTEPKYMRRASGNSNLERRFSGNPMLSTIVETNGVSYIIRRSGPEKARRSTPFRRTAFMDNNIQKYNERIRQAEMNLKTAIENMPLTKMEQWSKVKEIHPFLLTFRKLSLELEFLKLSDPLSKYYLLNAIVILVCVIIIQNLSPNRWEWSSWFGCGVVAFIILILLPVTWTHFVWSRFVKNTDSEYPIETGPENTFLKFLYKTSQMVTENVILRIIIYLIVCLLFSICVFVELIECKERYGINKTSPNKSNENFESFLRMLFHGTDDNVEFNCEIPWHMTETCCLTIIMSFLFLRIHVWIKMLFATGVTIFYSYCVSTFSEGFFKESETYNYMMKPQTAQIICIVYLTFTLHLIDRQTDYMNRLDHLWNIQLTDEQKEVNTVHKINTMLLKTILPVHVAELYLNVKRTPGELYHENYKSVGVMFASIVVDYEIDGLTEKLFLELMNQIIGDFDMLLSSHKGLPIEKIKVAKWTYMAACGLDPGRQGIESNENVTRSTDEVVVSLLHFAVNMIETLKRFNKKTFQKIKLKIGIAHGELAAGVVGSKKPLYDIWGDPVNMASRMDSTGEPGRIQVPEETAKVIQKHSIKCEKRGDIEIKGIKSLVTTYFVSLDKNNKLITEVQTKL